MEELAVLGVPVEVELGVRVARVPVEGQVELGALEERVDSLYVEFLPE